MIGNREYNETYHVFEKVKEKTMYFTKNALEI